MKSKKVSLRRRQLLIGGLAGAGVPAALHAARLDGIAELAAVNGENRLVVSGRIVAGNGKPLTGATVEILGANGAAAATATTDGDGRFYTAVAPAGGGRPGVISYRVRHGGQSLAAQELHFARGRQVAERRAGHLHRDDSGTWRAAFGLTLA